MPEEAEAGCARPTGGPVGEETKTEEPAVAQSPKEERSMIMVGQKAPDFTAPGYHQGKFINIKLSDFGIVKHLDSEFLRGMIERINQGSATTEEKGIGAAQAQGSA